MSGCLRKWFYMGIQFDSFLTEFLTSDRSLKSVQLQEVCFAKENRSHQYQAEYCNAQAGVVKGSPWQQYSFFSGSYTD